MIKECLALLDKNPPDILEQFYHKYRRLLRSELFLKTLINQKWSKQNYKRQCVFYKDIIDATCISYNASFRTMLNYHPAYEDFRLFIGYWFSSKFEHLPFEVYQPVAKAGMELLRDVFNKGELKKFNFKFHRQFDSKADSKDEEYIAIHNKYHRQMQKVLCDDKVLLLLLEEKKRWDIPRFEKFLRFVHMIRKALGDDADDEEVSVKKPDEKKNFLNVHPVYERLVEYVLRAFIWYYKALMYSDWKDLRQEGLKLMEELCLKNHLKDFEKNKKYKELLKKIPLRDKELLQRDYIWVNKLLKSKEYLKRNKGIRRDLILNCKRRMNEAQYEEFEQRAKDMFKTPDLLLAILDEPWGEDKYRILTHLGGIIGDEQNCRYIVGTEKSHYEVIPLYLGFEKYITNTPDYMGVLWAPKEELYDLAEETTELLKVFIREGKLHNYINDKRFDVHYKNRGAKYRELIKKGYKPPPPSEEYI